MSRIGVTNDYAGGKVTSAQNLVKIEQLSMLVNKSPVASHGIDEHSFATLQSSQNYVRIEGVAVCVDGDKATCGHFLTATGFVEIN